MAFLQNGHLEPIVFVLQYIYTLKEPCQTLSEGVLWETGGIEMELRSINLYFSILCACPSRKTGLSTMSNGDNVIYIPDDL